MTYHTLIKERAEPRLPLLQAEEAEDIKSRFESKLSLGVLSLGPK